MARRERTFQRKQRGTQDRSPALSLRGWLNERHISDTFLFFCLTGDLMRIYSLSSSAYSRVRILPPHVRPIVSLVASQMRVTSRQSPFTNRSQDLAERQRRRST